MLDIRTASSSSRSLPPMAPDTNASKDTATAKLNEVLRLRSYAESHGMVGNMQKLLRELLEARPDDPLEYMISFLEAESVHRGESQPVAIPEEKTVETEEAPQTVPQPEIVAVAPPVQTVPGTSFRVQKAPTVENMATRSIDVAIKEDEEE